MGMQCNVNLCKKCKADPSKVQREKMIQDQLLRLDFKMQSQPIQFSKSRELAMREAINYGFSRQEFIAAYNLSKMPPKETGALNLQIFKEEDTQNIIHWTCPSCTTRNASSSLLCQMCKQPKPIKTTWSCSQCTFVNVAKDQSCSMC